MMVEDALRTQDWKKLSAQLTVFAHARTRKRSWERACELSQEAILRAFEHMDGWDPEKEPILSHLRKSVLNLASNENKRKRYAADVVLDEDRMDALIDDKDTPEEALEKRHLLEAIYPRLTEKLKDGQTASIVLALIVEEVATPREQEMATGLPYTDIRNARTRIFNCAARIAAEVTAELYNLDKKVVPGVDE